MPFSKNVTLSVTDSADIHDFRSALYYLLLLLRPPLLGIFNPRQLRGITARANAKWRASLKLIWQDAAAAAASTASPAAAVAFELST